MNKHLIEAALWGGAALVLWLVPPPWKYLGYVLIALAPLVALSGYLDSRRRLKNAKAAVEKTKRELEELRKKNP
jgi:hypothetical protein